MAKKAARNNDEFDDVCSDFTRHKPAKVNRKESNRLKKNQMNLRLLNRFVDSLPDDESHFYIGIDPGSKGGIGLLHPKNRRKSIAIEIPVTQRELSRKTKKGNKAKRTVFDYQAIWTLFSEALQPVLHRARIFLERGSPRASDNGLVAFTVGVGWGMWSLFFVSLSVTVRDVWPNVWKKKMLLTGQDKSASIRKAQQLFDGIPISKDGPAEALLIAYYGRMLEESNPRPSRKRNSS